MKTRCESCDWDKKRDSRQSDCCVVALDYAAPDYPQILDFALRSAMSKRQRQYVN